MKKKVLCVGDSLALPGHLNKYEDTWFYKLKQKFPESDFISFFKRQLTTDVLVTMGGGENGIDNKPKGADCLEFYEPDIAILQLGIVDCAPRLLTKYDRIIVKFLTKALKKTYINTLKKFRKRDNKNTLVSYEKFKSNMEEYINRAKKIGAKIVIISISVPDEVMVEKNRSIIHNVNKYNDYYNHLDNNYDFITVTKPLSPFNYDGKIYEDGYHPNKKGHDIICFELEKILS